MDEQYYRMFLEGNQDGFEKLVLSHKDNLIYFIHRYVKDLNQAEDLAQDAFVEVYIHKDRYQFKSSFKTYLFTIGRNKAIDYIRKAGRQVLTEEVIPEEAYREEKALEDKIIAEEEKKLLNHAMKQLKKEYQEVLDLVYLQELSHKETALVLHKTTPQIKVLVHRGRKALGKILEKEGYVHDK